MQKGRRSLIIDTNFDRHPKCLTTRYTQKGEYSIYIREMKTFWHGRRIRASSLWWESALILMGSIQRKSYITHIQKGANNPLKMDIKGDYEREVTHKSLYIYKRGIYLFIHRKELMLLYTHTCIRILHIHSESYICVFIHCRFIYSSSASEESLVYI